MKLGERMNDEYVRKDVFESEIRRIEDSTSLAIQGLRERIDDQKERINDLKDVIVRGWAVLGVVATIAAIIFAGVQWYVASTKGGVSDDVSRAVIIGTEYAPAKDFSGTQSSSKQAPAAISVELP